MKISLPQLSSVEEKSYDATGLARLIYPLLSRLGAIINVIATVFILE